MQDALSTVHGLYAAFAEGDIPGFLAQLSPDVVWNEAEGFPLADRNPYVGGEAVVAGVFERLLPEWPGFRVEVKEIVGGPEVVTMFGRYRATHATTGKELDAECAHTWWIDDGKVVRFQQMIDTRAVAEAAQ